MRLFLGLKPRQQTQQQIDGLLAPLRQSASQVVWTPRENLHLTLAFLGEVDPGRLPELQAAAEQVAAGRAVFSLLPLRQPGAFIGWHNPHVIWLGVQPSEELDRLHRELWQDLQPLGLKVEQRWHPHITLGRVKRELPPTMATDIRQLTFDLPREVYRGLTLFESTLTPGGAKYREVRTFPFRD